MTATLDLSPILKSPRLPEISATLVNCLRDEAVRRQRFYDEMSDAQKVEFIQGEVIVHSPARNRHLCAKMALAKLLDTFVQIHKLGEVRDEKCLCVFPRNDYEPDVVFFGREKAVTFTPVTMKFPVPDFIVEVLSPTTESYDRGVKFEDYEAHGVGEYWIVDAEAVSVEQYVLEDGRFRLLLKSGSGDIESHVVTGFHIPIRAIFDPATNLETLRRLLA